MSWFRRYSRKCIGNSAGLSIVELLMGVAITVTAVAVTASMFQSSGHFLIDQQQQLEATQTARTAIDMMVRDLRLSGACLPITGDFMSLDGTTASVSGNAEDQIWTRTGLVQPNLSCITNATANTTNAVGSTIVVNSVAGFVTGMRGYIRGPASTGEYFDITSVNTSTNTLGRSVNFATDYPSGSGIYAIDERHFFIQHQTSAQGIDTPILNVQVAAQTASAFATGIESLDFQYELKRNCPPCDIVTIPADDNEWRLVTQIYLTLTARSDRTDSTGQFYRRTMTVGVKPRNLIP